MGLIDRVKNILLKPKSEWEVIAGETPSTGDLLGAYVAPLAGIAALCGFLGQTIVGTSIPFLGTYRAPIVAGLVTAVFTFAMAFVSVFILSWLINVLAPSFGGQKNSSQAMKVAVYAYTPGWIGGFLGVLPMLGLLGVLFALYGLYLLYLGLPRLMKNPPEKSLGYTVVVVICAIVIGFVTSMVVGGVTMMAGGGMMGAMRAGGGGFSADSPGAKLEAFGKKMEEVGKRMEAAEKKGDAQAQMQAAMEGVGMMLGGGKRYEPLSLDELKPFVPDKLGGLARSELSVESGGMPGLKTAQARGQYGDGGGKRIELEVTDTGGAGGLMALAGWAGVQGEKESNGRVERTRKEGNRLVREEFDKRGGSAEYTVIVGDRFVVEARGDGVSIDALRSAVGSLDLGRLESLREKGALPQR